MTSSTVDLRSFIDVLRSNGQLVDVNDEVSLNHDLGSRLHTVEEVGSAALFHRVKGSSIPVVGGLLSSHRNVALGLGCDVSGLTDVLGDAPDHPLPPEEQAGPAPCQALVDRSGSLLGTLPVPVHAPGDRGPFINAGVVIARDPNSGRHNLSFQRFQIRDDGLLGVHINRWRDLGEFLSVAESRGENLLVCIAIGLEPALMLAASYRSDADEYEIAGALRGSPVPVVTATTSDIWVPALAEIIIECEVIAGRRETEGPMAEYTGHYSGVEEQPVARIRCISHRTDPIFQTIAGASREHLLLGTAVTREPEIRRRTRSASPRVRDVYLAPYASGFLALISMEDPQPGEVNNVGIAAMSCHVNVVTVIVVDTDIDVYRESDVLWALSTRVRWAEDLLTLPNVLGNELHPAADRTGVMSKVIIDATLRPELRGKFIRVRYPSSRP